MAIAPIRRQRLNQPMGEGIDWANPITRYLKFAFEAGYGKRDLVTGVAGGGAGSGVTYGVGNFGKQVNFSGAQGDNAFEFGVHQGLFGATGTTFDILVYFASGNQTCHFFSQWDGQNQEWLLQNSSGTLIWVAADGTVANTDRTRFDLSAAFASAGWYRIIASWRGGTNRTLLINGVEKNASVNQSTATIVGTTTGDKIAIGRSVGGSSLNGSVVFARAWSAGLSADSCKRLADDKNLIYL